MFYDVISRVGALAHYTVLSAVQRKHSKMAIFGPSQNKNP
jgi:hypothetical protein